MEYSQPAKYQIIPSGDYLDIVCAKCRSTCAIDLQGPRPVSSTDRNYVPKVCEFGRVEIRGRWCRFPCVNRGIPH